MVYLSFNSVKEPCFIARTFDESPNRLINPSASLWLYSPPVVNEAMYGNGKMPEKKDSAPKFDMEETNYPHDL